MAFVQQSSFLGSASATVTPSAAITVTASNTLSAIVLCNGTAAVTNIANLAITDTPGDAWVFRGVGTLSGGTALALFTCTSAVGGSTQPVAGYTSGASSNVLGIYVREDSGLGAYEGFSANVQAGPAATADAVTSGTVSTITTGSTLIGFTYDSAGTPTTPVHGTGFTGRTAVWTNSAVLSSLPEDESASANAAATFTAGNHFDTFFTMGWSFAAPVTGDTLSAARGAFTLTGQAATLAIGSGNLTLVAATGAFSLTGGVSLTAYALDATMGQFNLNGKQVTFLPNATTPVCGGTFDILTPMPGLML